MARALDVKPAELLETWWFVQVRDHKLNSRGDKAAFMKLHKADALKDAAVGLRRFHALQRNVLDHGSIPEQRKILDAYPPALKAFHSDNRISNALSKMYRCAPHAKLQNQSGGTEVLSGTLFAVWDYCVLLLRD
ncbi:hypothetical protein GPECTOR_2g1471 [Gonium pectorale]|uniref:Uncharacterized protein n=1 Tax=Gonium pectorale TaxID=33097 RepID=A0A150H2W7_GONPE|nr:hypothetical protein GPECTOR_2g1471 [Gonium pectorale]|eukprot:KXZ55920.1 hypothetical protein GPECTOR_2g1471 [Gonium pectorale]